jgi:hypothetical protein
MPNRLTASTIHGFTGLAFLKANSSHGLHTRKTNRSHQSLPPPLHTGDYVTSCVGGWIGNGFGKPLNKRQQTLLHKQSKRFPWERPRSHGGFTRGYRSAASLVAIRETMAKRLQASYRLYDMRKRLMMGAEINLRKGYLLYKQDEFEASLEVLSEAIKFLRIQRKNHHTIETEDQINHLQEVVKSTWAGVDSLKKAVAEHESRIPIDICRATTNMAIQHFVDAKDKYRATDARDILASMYLDTVEIYMEKGLLEHCYPLVDDSEAIFAEVAAADQERLLRRVRSALPTESELTSAEEDNAKLTELRDRLKLGQNRANYLRGSLALRHGQLDMAATKWAEAIVSLDGAVEYIKNLVRSSTSSSAHRSVAWPTARPTLSHVPSHSRTHELTNSLTHPRTRLRTYLYIHSTV